MEKFKEYILHLKILLLEYRASGLVDFEDKNFQKAFHYLDAHMYRRVEFAEKSIAKRVARILNGEQIGGRKRSFYYDLWNIKYLSKFKWDDLTEEIAYKNAIREQKLALEISAVKRERDFYLSKVDQSHALSSIEERIKKVIRQFPQKKPVATNTEESKPRLSKDILAGIFGGIS